MVYQDPAIPQPAAQGKEKWQETLQVTVPFLWNDESSKAKVLVLSVPSPCRPLQQQRLLPWAPLLHSTVSALCCADGRCTCSRENQQHNLMQKMQTGDS